VLTTGVTQSSLIIFPPKNLPTKCLNSRMKNNGFWWWWEDGGRAIIENDGVSERSKPYLDLFRIVVIWSWLDQNGRNLVRIVEIWSWVSQNGRNLIWLDRNSRNSILVQTWLHLLLSLTSSPTKTSRVWYECNSWNGEIEEIIHNFKTIA
jgi:hypothetical protein